MAGLNKTLKKYERHFLLGLVILLLVTFSITGAVQCQGPEPDGGQKGLGGTFLVAPGERLTLSGAEVADARFRTEQVRARAFVPMGAGELSLQFLPLLFRADATSALESTWAHVMLTRAAERAGYRCGQDFQIKSAIRDVVTANGMGLQFSDELYQRFLKQRFGGGAPAFESVLAEVVTKDQFVQPLIETMRYSLSYPEAYETWKNAAEQVDLSWVAVRSEDFALPVRQAETTRERMSRDEAALAKLSRTVGTLRRLRSMAEARKAAADGAWPETLAAVTGSQEAQTDGWGGAISYAVEGGEPRLVAPGPDGLLGTGDDVTVEVVRDVEARVAVREVAQEVLKWFQREGTWPESLVRLHQAPPGGGLPALPREVKDGWGRAIVFEPPEGGQPPRVASAGPDGEPDTGDEVPADLTARRLVVPLGARLEVFVDAALEDAWGRPFRRQLLDPVGPQWEVRSAGPDGEFDTEDDLVRGNATELQEYYNRPEVRTDFTTPERRRFEALFVHPPLLPDRDLRRFWEAFPEHHPDEEEVFGYWRQNYGPGEQFEGDDPGNPETGWGVEAARRIHPEAPLTVVPDASIFGVLPPAFGIAEEGEDGEGERDAQDPLAPDPLRRTYVKSGWRAILLRDHFLDRLFTHVLERARTSLRAHDAWRDAHAAWTAANAAWERADAAWPARGEGEEGARAWEEAKVAWEAANASWRDAASVLAAARGGDPPPVEDGEGPGNRPGEPAAPALATLEDLLADPLGDFLPGEADPRFLGFLRTPDEAITREEWESLPGVGGVDLTNEFRKQQYSRPGAYGPVVASLNGGATKAILRSLSFEAPRVPPLEDVRGEVFERFLARKRLDRAQDVLQQVRRRIAEAEETPFDEKGREALAQWAAEAGVPVAEGSTGLFIGARPPRARKVPEGTPEEEALLRRRQQFVRTTGYEAVREAVADPEKEGVAPGLFASRILRDEASGGTASAFLVRVRERVHPPREAFSPRDYAAVVTRRLVGDLASPNLSSKLKERRGILPEAVARFFGGLDWLGPRMEFSPETRLELVEERQRR